MNIVFRVDASFEIGSGHVMRCLVLAHKFREIGIESWFICREYEGSLCELIESHRFYVERIDPPGEDLIRFMAENNKQYFDFLSKLDVEQTKIAIYKRSSTRPEWIVVDHYGLDKNWEIEIGKLAKRLLVIDDFLDREHACDLFVNQNLLEYGSSELSINPLKPCKKLIGPRYALLTSEYRETHLIQSVRSGRIRRIFMFFGGMDNSNITQKAISAFIRVGRSDIKLDVVLGQANINRDGILSQIAPFDNIELHMGISSLASLISRADLGISACGTNTWERLCLGLPSIVITIAENQRPIAKVLSSLGLIKWLGDDLEVDEEKILVSLKAIIEKEVSPDWSKACFGVVDGLGANRVVAAMSAVENDLLTVRPVSLVDEDLLLDWVNDPETRRSSFDSKRIDPLTHHSWMKKKLSSPATVYFYIVSVANKFPIGQVRFEAVDSDWEIHFSLAPDFRSLGIAKYFLLAAINKFREQVKIGEIFGRVKKENTSSSKLFKGLGFDVNELATGDEFLVFISHSL